MRESFSSFWEKNPALFLGLSLLLGSAFSFRHHPLLALLFAALYFSQRKKNFLYLCTFCFVTAFFYAEFSCPQVTLPHEKIKGKGVFHVEEIKVHTSPFHRSLLYRGTLKQFETEEGSFSHLPCSIYLPLYGKQPQGGTDFEIEGILCQKAERAFLLKPEKKKPWTLLFPAFSLAKWRFDLKKQIAEYLKREISHVGARSFLTALATAETDERILSMQLGKLGLQHILAISGFHFALAALFLNTFFRFFLPRKASLIALLFVLTSYYIFLGNAPSIQRAYIGICAVAIGHLVSKKITPLNALGLALIVELLCNPLVVTQLNFQLSFLCTIAILLFYTPIHQLLKQVFPERSFSEATQMSRFDQHIYILSAILRKTLSVNLAVHLISVPVLLHLFHKFPLLSLAYNLFFPFCATLSLLLLFTACSLSFFPSLSHFLHQCNAKWTSFNLTITANPPAFFDFCIRTKAINFSSLLCFLSLSFFIGILLHERTLEKNVV